MRTWLLYIILVVSVTAACGPSTPPTPAASGGGGPSPAVPTAPKVLTVGVQREPADLGVLFGTGTSNSAGGAGSVKLMVHDKLAIETELDDWRPQLAVALPSVEAGTWSVNPDGTMDTTWRIHPNTFWHDGVPFTSADLMFSFKIFMDPELPNGRPSRPFAHSATAPDPQTFIIHWATMYVDADQGEIGVVRPAHILDPIYTRSREEFTVNPWFTYEFVGLGPYKLARWQQGSFMQLERFDAYYKGRPPLDRIVVRFIGDPNALVANILAGDLDVILPVTVDLDAALDLRERWQGTGNQVRVDLTGGLTQLEMQFRPVARPVNGFSQRLVRQAFYQAIDRNALSEIMTQSLSPVADSWYPPLHTLRPLMEDAIPKYPHDPREAISLLAQAGWNRGPDGTLVHTATGERFATAIWGLTGQVFATERQLSILAEDWKALGAQVEIMPIPTNRQSDGQFMAEHPGPLLTNFNSSQFTDRRFRINAIPSAATLWSGFNRGGYENSRVDGLYDVLSSTIDQRQRIAPRRELVREVMGDVALMPLYWTVVPTIMVKGVSGPHQVGTEATRNIFEWTKD
jgi:peptide/nickel transport system substrate-binding protein